mgnify:CR=1 FL=1
MTEKISRENKKLQLRENILNAAAHEFAERGFIHTTVSNIMNRANLGVGTFYNYFGSKEEVLMNLVKNLFTEVEKKIQAEKNLSSLELLQNACEYTAALIEKNKFILPLLGSAMNHADKPELLPKNLSPSFKKIFEEIILRGQSNKEIRADIPADLISELFHSIYQAAAFSKLDISFRENVRLKVKILLDGLILRS